MRFKATAALSLGAAAALVSVMGTAPRVGASSHAEAPYVKEVPKCDATDFYMFMSYEPGREEYVTLIANYYPLQDPYGGPNYFNLDSSALYQIHVDNNADAVEDITFSFRFNTENRDLALDIGGQMVSIPLVNAGVIGPLAEQDQFLNVAETYRLNVVRGNRYTGQSSPAANAETGDTVFRKPADNIGNKSIPDYAAYAADHIYTLDLPGSDLRGRVFVGQRKDPFVVNLGEVFDLVNTNPLGPENAEIDDLADKNVTSLILEIPKSYLVAAGSLDPVIGGWTTASLPRTRVLTPNPTFDKPASETGAWTQVSRLSMPLVNEVVIGLKDKNRFNASEPRNDGQFLTYVTNPTLPALLNILFGVTEPCLPRDDLVAVFLTGVPGLNQPVGVTPGEMMRMNTAIPPSPSGKQNRLGVIGGDVAGFPNGRRPGDDVVDIELRVVLGALYADAGVPGGCAPHGNLPVTDGAFVDSSFFFTSFPYVKTPIPGSPRN